MAYLVLCSFDQRHDLCKVGPRYCNFFNAHRNLLTAIVLGWQESLAAAQETAATTPALWVAYLLVGAVMLAALAFSFCMDEK